MSAFFFYLFVISIIACFDRGAVAATQQGVAFNASFGDHMVLQRSPARAAVFGTTNGDLGPIRIFAKDSRNITAYQIDAAVDEVAGLWSAYLRPTNATPDDVTWTIHVRGSKSNATIESVIFGDIWYCGGQSNMALPLLHTMSRNQSVASIESGLYAGVRLHGIAGNMNPDQPWITAKDASKDCMSSPNDCALFKYSSTCWYFAESLIDKLGGSLRNVGLIHTAFGGSTIEQWLDNETIAECRNTTLDSSNGMWHEHRVMPYTAMTVKGWIWYQGENDMHGVHGNSALGYGYACLMPKLVDSWRALWSVSDGTTDPKAPFGLVTLASSGSEGGRSMGTFRWAQTASFGRVPNSQMTNTFLAHAYDLDDPWSNTSCYEDGCCPNNYAPKGTCNGCLASNQYCANLTATNYYMGPIHPRDKKPVGERLAIGAAATAYGSDDPFTGPTIASCRMTADEVAGERIIIAFDADVSVRDYASRTFPSKMEVLTNASLFCMQTGNRGETCVDDGTGHPLAYDGAFDDTTTTWMSVDISPSQSSSREVVVDISSAPAVFALRYAWSGTCCDGRPSTSEPCPIASCPLVPGDDENGLPVNPFIARIVHGKCVCVAPQACG
eukprot:g818.t1